MDGLTFYTIYCGAQDSWAITHTGESMSAPNKFSKTSAVWIMAVLTIFTALIAIYGTQS
jgi:hypothetical protein